MLEPIISPKAREAMKHIREFIMRGGKMPSMRELMKKMDYKSPLSAMILLNELAAAGFLEKKREGGFRFLKDLIEGDSARTVAVPLVGFANCGGPMVAEENFEAMIQVSVQLAKPGGTYFLLRAKGDSMDEADIHEGDLLLIKQQSTAENGEIVVALIDDEATIKEIQKSQHVVKLVPRSSNAKHQPIIMNTDFKIQGVVKTVIPKT